MLLAALRVLSIKDLKDLSVLLVRRCYRHAGPKGPEEGFLRGSNDRGGQAPALRAREGFSSLCAIREQAIPNYGLLKVCKTLMPIVYRQ